MFSRMWKLTLLIVCFSTTAFAQRNSQDDAVLSRIASGNSDSRLSQVSASLPRGYLAQKEALDRLQFNTFLRTLRPAYAVKNRIDAEQKKSLRAILKDRHLWLQRAVDSIVNESGASDDEFEELLKELLREDEKRVEAIETQLEEILTPKQRTGLLKVFLEAEGEWAVFDPLVRRWLGLSSLDVARMKDMRDKASSFLRSQLKKEKINGSKEKLPAPIEAEYRKKKALMWSHLSAETIEKILRSRGLILDEEGLVAYLDRNELDRQALIDNVPAFARAAESD